jgi:hypothetical protein
LAGDRAYGESSAAGTAKIPKVSVATEQRQMRPSPEDFSHFGIGITREPEREPREVGDELVVGLRVHLVGDDGHAPPDLSLEMLDPFFGEISHASKLR